MINFLKNAVEIEGERLIFKRQGFRKKTHQLIFYTEQYHDHTSYVGKEKQSWSHCFGKFIRYVQNMKGFFETF